MPGRSGFGVQWLADFTALVGGTPTYAAIGQIDSINGPDMSADTIDTTPGDTTDGSGNPGWRSFEAYLKDGGQVTIEFSYDEGNSQHQALATNFGLKFANRIQFPIRTAANTVPARWTFNGILTGLSPAYPQGDKMTATATLKVDGQPTFSAEAAI